MPTRDSGKHKADGKTYDIQIIKWLYGFTGPYRAYMALALVFMLVTALLELAVPYIAKIAVDRYIYPSWKIVTIGDKRGNEELERNLINRYPSLVVSLGGDSYLMDTSGLRNADSQDLEKSGSVSEKGYIVIDPSDFDKAERKRVLGVIDGNPDIFTGASGIYYADYKSLDRLGKKDLLTVRSNQISQVVKLAGLLFLCILGVFLFSSAFTYLLNYSGHRIMHTIRTGIFSHILSLPQTYFDKNPVGRLTTRVTNDVNAINEMYTSVLVQFVKDVLVVIGIFIIMFSMNRVLTLYVFIFTILMAIFAALFRMKLKSVYREIRRTIARLNAFVQESVRGVVLIKLYNRESANFERFMSINRENFNANMDQLWVYATFRPFIEFTSVFTVAVILWAGGIKVMNLDLTLGALIAYLYYVRMLFRPIMELAEKYNIFQSAAAASENLYEISIALPEPREGLSHADVQGSLEFRDVWFSYDKKEWVLKGISFKIEPGETVALVGLTGSGKTTIVNLILKFYELDRGRILFDGTDIRELSPGFLRESISAVFQDLFIFGKRLDNGKSGVPDERLQIEELDTLRKSNGHAKSSGEKQLVSLEYALSKKAKFLILDEATSSIDANIEQKVQDRIRNKASGKTTLIIAHRLSNVREADRIVVIHKGRITETGSHSELLANKGIYADLYELQNEIRKFSSVDYRPL